MMEIDGWLDMKCDLLMKHKKWHRNWHFEWKMDSERKLKWIGKLKKRVINYYFKFELLILNIFTSIIRDEIKLEFIILSELF